MLVAYLKHSGKLVKHLNEHNIEWEWLGNFKQNRPIRFQSRDDYRDALEEILTNKQVNTEKTGISAEILRGYNDIENIFLEGVLSENKQTLKNFCDFLLENVKIMRIPTPPDTDRHHYFEIMNSRGKQLEKHEILKFKMIDALHDEQSRSCFSIVWDVCANMGHYVQMGFLEEERKEECNKERKEKRKKECDKIFGKNWDGFYVKDFEELQKIINRNPEDKSTLSNIIGAHENSNINISPESKPEFKSIIDFPKFLLHVLRVQTKSDIKKDDKELLEVFGEHILNDSKKVKEFAYNLLLCKFLYDQYIIKINLGSIDETGRWSLKRLKKQNDNSKPNNDKSKDKYVHTFVHNFGEEDNKRIIMLLSSLHVSETGSAKKYWLDAALNHLVGQWEENQNIEAKRYLKHMEEVATSFVFDRSLSPNGDLDYFSIIYKNNGECQARKDISHTKKKSDRKDGELACIL